MLERVMEKLRAGVLFCIKWRYLVALIIFIFCVALGLHGSSIGEYDKTFNGESQVSEEIWFGQSRAIRADEWTVHTPYYMSQQYNGFSKDSNMMSLGGQDMIIGYNAPVADITLIAKPFTWGYFLLGNERGLSWYWCSKLILLMLVTFEVCMLITGKNKKVSLLGMLMISFAPAVQWWYVPHAVDVLFWAMAVLVLAYHFFTSQKWWRILYMVLLPLSVITFAMTLFPSLQLSFGLTMLALFIALIVRDKKQITFKKKDFWRIVLMVLVVIGVLGYTIITSKDAILTLYNTVYPGGRVELGGSNKIEDLFTDLTSFMLPFRDITYLNNSEVSTFIHFAPVFLMLYPIIYKKMKKDKNIIVGNALVICLGVMIVFMLAGFPELLAKISGFSYINRMKIAYGLAGTILTVWGISMIWKKNIFTKKQILTVIAIYGFAYICFIGNKELTYASWRYYAIVIAGLLALVYLMLSGQKKLFLTGMVSVMIISGFTINPIARGTAAIFEHPLEQEISRIAEQDAEAYWVVIGDTRLASLGIANGARVLSMTNFYPDYEKWRLLDPEGLYDDIYNRYAHIIVDVAEDGKTRILPGAAPDAMNLEISYEDLAEKWPTKYLLSDKELEAAEKYYKEIYEDTEGNYYIYERVGNER